MEHWLHCAISFVVYHHLVSKGLSSFPKSSVKTHQQLLTDAPRKLHLKLTDLLLPPATKLGQGYVFTGVRDSVHRGGT